MAKFLCRSCNNLFDERLDCCPLCGCHYSECQLFREVKPQSSTSEQSGNAPSAESEHKSQEEQNQQPTTNSSQHESQEKTVITCADCGHAYDSNLEVCPECGCPVMQLTAHESDEYYNDTGPKKSKLWVWVLVLLAVCALAAGGYYLYMDKASVPVTGQKEESDNLINGKYSFILYNDNMGEFRAPNGGRICDFRLPGGRGEPLTINLSRSIKVLGKSTDRLYISNDRLFSDYSDYLSYNSSYHPDKTLGVPVERKDEEDGECYIASFSNGQIEHIKAKVHSIKPTSSAEYTLLYYNDEYGTLYDAKGKRICGAKKSYSTGELCVDLSKSVSIYGVTTKEIAIDGDDMFTSNHDLIHSHYLRDGEPSPHKAIVKRKDEGDAIIYMFSKVTSSVAEASQYGSSPTDGGKWNVNSANELKGKLAGTVWTCRPTGSTWYRLVFSSSQMTLYFAEPQMGRWSGGDKKYNYTIENSYTADTGEKCVSVQFRDPDDRFSYGALFFLKGGNVDFSWLRGKYGGKAECKDFNWDN